MEEIHYEHAGGDTTAMTSTIKPHRGLERRPQLVRRIELTNSPVAALTSARKMRNSISFAPLPWTRGILWLLRIGALHPVRWIGNIRAGQYRAAGRGVGIVIYASVALNICGLIILIFQPEMQSMLFNRRSSAEDPIRKEVDFAVGLMHLVRLAASLSCAVLLRWKGAILAQLLNDLSRLWQKLSRPFRPRSALAFCVTLLCVAQLISLFVVVALESFYRINDFSQGVFSLAVLYTLVPVEAFLIATSGIHPVVIFIVMTITYSTLIDCLDTLLMEFRTLRQPLRFMMDVLQDVRRILGCLASIALHVGLPSVTTIGVTSLITIFNNVMTNERETFPRRYYSVLATVLMQFIGLTAALYLSHRLSVKLMEVVDILDSPALSHLPERDIRAMSRTLRGVRHPATAVGFLRLDLSPLLTIFGFLMTYTMVFIQFKAIVTGSKTGPKRDMDNLSSTGDLG